ncbi:MAG: glutamate-5-semialdehyde dehydrogenase, partial [Erysipelotrichaceae bacterium]
MSELILKGQKAKEASNILGNLSTDEKNKGLLAMADFLVKYKEFIIEANKIDLQEAVNSGTAKTMLDRLSLDETRVEGMANGLRQVASLPDPVGEVVSMWTRPNGLQIGQKRVAMGVIGIIYEARPNVTSDAAGLCFKAGSAVILRGGKEAIYSNKAIVKVLIEALKSVNLPESCIQLIEDTSREVATKMMRLNEYIDVLIPRGGAGLIKAVVNNATVPVIETGTGNCHIYVDEECDFEMAKNIIINAKTSRPSVCNATEKLLVNKNIAKDFMPFILKELRDNGVEVRGDESAIAYDKEIVLASEEEWYNEYLDYKIGVKVVKDIDEAISHINNFSSGHSEAIITKSYESSQKFLQRVNSAAVYVNASTRFTDGE